MKVFTIAAIILIVISLPVFSGGQSEAVPMMDGGAMEPADAMDAGKGSEMENPLVEFKNADHAMMLAETKPTVLFFNASWCPSCRSAMKNFEKNVDELNGINLVLVDYDNSDELQKKYGVTYQHTFVQIDSEGNSLATWNGGDIKDLLGNVIREM